MYIIDNILSILKSKGLKQVDMCEYIGINTSTMTTWKNRKTDPPAKYIILICEFLNVSPYVLLTGKEKNSPTDKLSDDEQELITYYRQLDPKSQGILLGRAETMAENRQIVTDDPPKNAPCVTTSLVYSRSTDNMPPRTVIGDFSDILNAPDATDEY